MLRGKNWSLLLLQSVSQLLSKIITNKLTVSSTTDTLLENQIFISVFLIEHYDYAAVRKGLLITLFVKLFKTTNLGKPYL